MFFLGGGTRLNTGVSMCAREIKGYPDHHHTAAFFLMVYDKEPREGLFGSLEQELLFCVCKASGEWEKDGQVNLCAYIFCHQGWVTFASRRFSAL